MIGLTEPRPASRPSFLDESGARARLRQNVAFIAIALLILAARRPDALLAAQFWAEDGLWYADAYHHGGLRALFTPWGGYFQTASRLVGWAAQAVPLAWAPLVFNMVAIVAEVLPVSLLLSSRFDGLIPSRRLRFLIGTLYVLRPNSEEVHATLTHVQIHLALLAFMILVAAPAAGRWWRAFDAGAVLLSAVSGPFCLMLAPVAAVRWLTVRRQLILLLILTCGAALQAATLVFFNNRAEMASPSLGATPFLLLKILGGQLVLAQLIGGGGYRRIVDWGLWKEVAPVLVAGYGCVLVAYAFVKGRAELRLLIAFALALTAAALSMPLLHETLPQWQLMWEPTVGQRYWFIPAISFLITIIVLARQNKSRIIKLLAVGALCVTPIGVLFDVDHRPYIDFQFRERAREFEGAPPGTSITFLINPSGWTMTLRKR